MSFGLPHRGCIIVLLQGAEAAQLFALFVSLLQFLLAFYIVSRRMRGEILISMRASHIFALYELSPSYYRVLVPVLMLICFLVLI